MSKIQSRVYCEKNVIVDFFLAGHNVEKMEVFIYHQNFDRTHSLIGIVNVLNDEIIFEVFPNIDSIRYTYYQIGVECIKRIQHYPEAILG